MNPTTYRIISSYAGRWLSWSHPWPLPAVLPFPLRVTAAVYVVIDGEGRICYVGSVCRGPGSGLADRLAEHLDDPDKRARWQAVWVVPLRPHTAPAEVRRIEGVIGAHLQPYGSRRLPMPRPPDFDHGRGRGLDPTKVARP